MSPPTLMAGEKTFVHVGVSPAEGSSFATSTAPLDGALTVVPATSSVSPNDVAKSTAPLASAASATNGANAAASLVSGAQ
jgi:hypothetical protein